MGVTEKQGVLMVFTSGVSNVVSAIRSDLIAGSNQSPHPYNTRLQARLRADAGAMNDPRMVDYLLDGVEPNQDHESVSPRVNQFIEGASSNGSSSSSESSEAQSSIDNSEEMDSEEVHSADLSTQEDSEMESEKFESASLDSNEVSHNQEMASEEVASEEESLEKGTAEEEPVVHIDIGELVKHLMGSGQGSGSNSLDSIRDKTTFLESVGINLTGANQFSQGQEQIEKSEKMWQDFRNFNSSQLDLILSLDRFEISGIMAKIHVDSKVSSGKKSQLLTACNKLNSLVQGFKTIDERFKGAADFREMNNVSDAELLRINAGELARGMALLTDTQSLLQSVGYSLQLDNLEVAMKSGLQVHRSSQDSKITFDDVVGIDEAKAELQEIVAYLKNPQSFTQLGARIPKGVLLSGSPGTGKTLLAKAVAGEAGVPFFSVSGSAFVEEFVGVGAKRVRELFQQANSHESCILFIDELDAVGGKRNARNDGGGQEHDQTLNQLLTEMDGFTGRSGVIVMAATNRPDILDSALKRPGRFDRNIPIPLPTVNGREAILKLHAKKRAVDPSVDFNALARRTSGYSGAELENLINEAALLAGRDSKTLIGQKDLEAAHDKLIMGVEVSSFHMSEKNRLNTAYHESGHAIVSYLLEEHDPVYKVTIMPRGFSLGATHYLPDEDDTSISFRKLKGQLCSLMGGRVAEEILLGEDGVTTGASNDLKRASSLARKMVMEWGFSKELGPVTFRGEDGMPSVMSTHTSQMIDQEVKKIIIEAETSARDVLLKNRDKLDAMAALLMEKETIDQNDVTAIMSAISRRSSTGDGSN